MRLLLACQRRQREIDPSNSLASVAEKGSCATTPLLANAAVRVVAPAAVAAHVVVAGGGAAAAVVCALLRLAAPKQTQQ